MFSSVLVGVDGHDGGQDAIALGRQLIVPGGSLTLAYVYPGDPYRRPERTTRGVRAADHARDLLEEARQRADVTANLRWRRSSSTGRGLHELAEMVEADLLVVGSSRRGLVGRVLQGDDTQAALSGAPCPVAIAPAGYGRWPTSSMRVIGVGYDGSPESERALQVARELAADIGATLSAFPAVSLPSGVVRPGPVPLAGAVDTTVEEAGDVAALHGVDGNAADGELAEELAGYSTSVDLLVVGSRGYAPLRRLVHGNTTQHLARTAACPLLVLSRTAREAHTPPLPDEGHHEATPAGAA
jgi:nucleotide-binding universal stress UspA family protein